MCEQARYTQANQVQLELAHKRSVRALRFRLALVILLYTSERLFIPQAVRSVGRQLLIKEVMTLGVSYAKSVLVSQVQLQVNLVQRCAYLNRPTAEDKQSCQLAKASRG